MHAASTPAKMSRWRLIRPVLAGICCCALAAHAEVWRGNLQQGGEFEVDPDTRRAIGNLGNQPRPLWDGVHQLEDGSTVIVRDGIAVPTESMLEAWTAGPRPEPTFESRYCNQLVRKTCGFDNACNTSAACLRARSMLGDEAREQRGADQFAVRPPQTETSNRCVDALNNPEFAACDSLVADDGDSRCRALVVRVCGVSDGCGQSPACDAARQLLSMETEERLTNDDPSELSATGTQCLEAMENRFFEACLVDGPEASARE